MEMRLIDAYALQDEIYKSKMQNPHKDAKTATNHEFEHDHFMKMVALQPTAQEEIVRCKDCKHRTRRICNNIELWECNHIRYELAKCGVTDDWFCADGERKDGDD